MAELRIHLTGRMSVQAGPVLIRDEALRGRQMRLAFAFLVAGRLRPQPVEDLCAAVWPDGELPPAWDAAVSSLLSKIRRLLRSTGAHEVDIARRSAAVQLMLPREAWVDIEAAPHAVDEAEGHMRSRNLTAAWGAANVAVCLARDPLLPEEPAPWLAERRALLKRVHARGLGVLAAVSLATGEHALAVTHAEQLVELDPMREESHRQLIETHAALGNRAEALQAFERCRRLLRDELGTSPSPETEGVYLRVLRS